MQPNNKTLDDFTVGIEFDHHPSREDINRSLTCDRQVIIEFERRGLLDPQGNLLIPVEVGEFRALVPNGDGTYAVFVNYSPINKYLVH